MAGGTAKLKSSQASDQILEWIKRGRFAPGERLPSERAMAEELRINHLTVRRGLAALVSRGLVQKRPNVGNFVSEALPTAEIAIILPRFILQGGTPHPLYNQLIAGIHGGVDQRTATATVLSYRPGALWEDVGDVLVARRIRGVILAPGSDVHIEHIQPFLRAGISIVLIKPSIALAPLGLTSVFLDMSATMAQLLEGILERGHRRVVVAQYDAYGMHEFDRQIIESGLRRYGITDVSSCVLEVPNTGEAIDTSVLERIFTARTLPSAVMLQDEYQASALFRMCYERGVRIPDEMSLAAVFDSTPHLHPVPLTAADSVAASLDHGRIAASLLVKLMAGEKLIEREIRIRCDVRWRASLAPVPAARAGLMSS
jgi:DNA-binding LacI/PurR family transcriptional regulator